MLLRDDGGGEWECAEVLVGSVPGGGDQVFARCSASLETTLLPLLERLSCRRNST